MLRTCYKVHRGNDLDRVQEFAPESWNSTKELLWNEAEIQWRAWCASNLRAQWFSEYYREVMDTVVKDSARPHEERAARYTKVWKKLMRSLNFLGMSDSCVFSQLGYFR